MFYINKAHLQSHADKLAEQTRRIRNLRNRLRQTDFSDQPEAYSVRSRCIRRLDNLEEVLVRVHSAMQEYEESYDSYSARLDAELDELVADVKLLF